ncbi:hypothetical protein D3C80_1421530 [compost metagenome]
MRNLIGANPDSLSYRLAILIQHHDAAGYGLIVNGFDVSNFACANGDVMSTSVNHNAGDDCGIKGAVRIISLAYTLDHAIVNLNPG